MQRTRRRVNEKLRNGINRYRAFQVILQLPDRDSKTSKHLRQAQPRGKLNQNAFLWYGQTNLKKNKKPIPFCFSPRLLGTNPWMIENCGIFFPAIVEPIGDFLHHSPVC